MRLLLVNLGYPPNTVGGAELAIQSLARELVRQGAEVTVCSLSQNHSDWHYEDAGVQAYFVNAHPMGNLLLNPKRTLPEKVAWHLIGELNRQSAHKITDLIRQERIDLVHTQNLTGLSVGVWNAARAAGCPIVHTLQDYQLLCPRGTMFRGGTACRSQCLPCRLFTARRRLASRIPSVVVGISRSILSAHMTHGYFRGAIPMVIPNGYSPPNGARLKPDKKTGGSLRIGFIGRLHPAKGVELLLRVLADLPPGVWAAKIAGAGAPHYEARLRALAHHLPVDFLGWVDGRRFYDHIDVLVVPSVYAEPQGLVLLEAASFGVPVVYANHGGLGEMGAAFAGCWPFEPTNPNQLRERLLCLITDSKNGTQGNTQPGDIPHQFRMDSVVAEYRHAYETAFRRFSHGRHRSPKRTGRKIGEMEKHGPP
jgi:glycosyltransferase involved in cell wall biosynthesis